MGEGNLPAGRTFATSVGTWEGAVRAAPEVQQLRGDAHRNLLAVVGVLARRASWDALTSWPTWQTIQNETELGRRTIARWLCWLRRHSWLGIVETGSTPTTRPMALAHLDGNRAAVYALLTPAEEPAQVAVDPVTGEILEPTADGPADVAATESGTPTGSRREPCTTHLGYSQHAHARANSSRLLDLPRTAAKTKTDRLAACEALRAVLPLFRTRSARLWRHLLSDWFDAGWTPADIAWHLDHRPTSNPTTGPSSGPAISQFSGDPSGQVEPWPYAWSRAADIRNAGGWVLTRLRAWIIATPDGTGEIPLSRTQRLAGAHAEQLAAQRARADADAKRAAAAARGDAVHRHADTARANLRAALRAAARPPSGTPPTEPSGT